jgi:Spy/CpxP family protein refolding chaperone
MFRACLLALFACVLVLSAGSFGQDNKPKEEPKKSDPPVKVKGMLPPNWGRLGLTDTQVQEIYKIRNKHSDEIAKLKAKIAEHEAARDKESKAVLTAEQKKRLDEILTGKDKEK